MPHTHAVRLTKSLPGVRDEIYTFESFGLAETWVDHVLLWAFPDAAFEITPIGNPFDYVFLSRKEPQ